LRQRALVSERQAQTADTFGFKWHKRDTFESDASIARMKAWLVERYGDVERADWWSDHGERPVLLDAGCGGAMSALALFERVLPRVRYVGVDISDAVDVAAARFAERGLEAAFVQADLNRIPLADGSVDVLFSEGVLHHTDSTRDALLATARLLAPGGRYLFYVYRRKGPVREFTDDYIRERLQAMTPDQAWEAVMPLTRLGKVLGDLRVEVDVPEAIELLEIPAGPIDLQRLFYWHVFKAFHHPDLTLDELNHINFDWYAPRNAHRQTPDEVRAWCAEAGLEVEREVVEDAGITIVARRAA
jgi:SAM-dependent methyltransferase